MEKLTSFVSAETAKKRAKISGAAKIDRQKIAAALSLRKNVPVFSFCGSSKAQQIFVTMGLWAAACVLPCRAAPTSALSQPTRAPWPNLLPWEAYPSLEDLRPTPPENNLQAQVENVKDTVSDTVRDFARHKNTSCFGDDCLFQLFPILYVKKETGFFGGFRSKLTNISRLDPPLYSIELQFLRSDQQEQRTYLAVDLPKISWLPLKPRLKVRGQLNRTTEVRYYGSGLASNDRAKSTSVSDLRYELEEYGIQSTLLVPTFDVRGQKLQLFASVSSLRHEPSPFDPNASVLFSTSPRGIEGGFSTRLGAGILIDTRDSEILSSSGWATELAAEWAGDPFGNFKFQRYSFIDRRYFTEDSLTLATRLTVDSLSGDAPFWELAGVGGSDPIYNVSGSQILRGYPMGRYHESTKVIGSVELRLRLKNRRALGHPIRWSLVPLSANLGRLGPVFATSFATGVKVVAGQSFAIQSYWAASPIERRFHLEFGQDF